MCSIQVVCNCLSICACVYDCEEMCEYLCLCGCMYRCMSVCRSSILFIKKIIHFSFSMSMRRKRRKKTTTMLTNRGTHNKYQKSVVWAIKVLLYLLLLLILCVRRIQKHTNTHTLPLCNLCRARGKRAKVYFSLESITFAGSGAFLLLWRKKEEGITG